MPRLLRHARCGENPRSTYQTLGRVVANGDCALVSTHWLGMFDVFSPKEFQLGVGTAAPMHTI